MKLPYQINRPVEAVMLAMLTACCLASYFFYQRFPAKVPIHWNMAGQPDDWSGPGFAAFFFPALIIGMYLLLTLLPLADPYKDRYKEFGRPYGILRLALITFMTALYFISSLAGLGYEINISLIVPLGVGLLFIVLGNFLPKFKKNWFVGIRTPWTLSDERVWTKTHRLAGKLFILGGLLMLISGFTPPGWNVALLLITVCLIVIGTIGYSYWLWRRLREEK
ncbi:SdpI family protein [Patescibacteria group bacterium]|nr:SdpI family protein [Patescibacteria group bacterium]